MPQDSIASPVRTIPTDAEAAGPEKGLALCLSGGGYRAMIFHVGALWRLNEAGALRILRRVSSVSGGSITAAVLGMNWARLDFDPGTGVARAFEDQLVDPVRKLAGRTIDEGAIIAGVLLPGSVNDRVANAYDTHLYHGATLEGLPDDAAGPRFVINATNVQTGSLWRFSKPYMGDYQVGLIRRPNVPLAKAVAASSAFPPVLSPCTLDVRPEEFDPATRGQCWGTPYNDEVVLSDGGVYDNLGLETAYKRYKTILASDAGQRMSVDPAPAGDWARHSLRVVGLIDNQVRSLRKRQLIGAYMRKERSGAFWGVASHFADYQIDDPLGVGQTDTAPLAAIKTRLKRMDAAIQERLINWGYAICDAALRKHCAGVFAQEYGLTVGSPNGLPYPEAGL